VGTRGNSFISTSKTGLLNFTGELFVCVIEVWQIFTCFRGYENNIGIPVPGLSKMYSITRRSEVYEISPGF
jgi:hypothetical protein